VSGVNRQNPLEKSISPIRDSSSSKPFHLFLSHSQETLQMGFHLRNDQVPPWIAAVNDQAGIIGPNGKRNPGHLPRLLQRPDRLVFLFGPREMGKSPWFQEGLPGAFRLDLLNCSLFLELGPRNIL
jgi:hypothetical protein